MPNVWWFVPAIAAALSMPRPAVAQVPAPADTGSTIQTTGSAQLTLQPTRAIITFGVASRAASAAAATAVNEPKVRRLLTALHASRPKPDSVLVVAVTVGPHENEHGTIVDYEASAEVRVVIVALDSLGRYLDVGLEGGATAVSDVSFQSDSAAGAQRRALGKAYEEALGRAQALAAAAGGTLGRLQTVSTERVGGEYFAVARTYAPAAETGIPMTPQGVTVSASVAAVWRFTPRSGP